MPKNFRKAKVEDIPRMLEIVREDMKEQMKWDDKQIEECLKQYIRDNEASVGLINNKIVSIALG